MERIFFMNTMLITKTKKYLKLISPVLLITVTNLAIASGSSGQSLGAIVNNVQKNVLSLISLLIIIAYVAGVGFALAGILQFKAHKDNPTQVPLSKPIVFLAVAACLLFMPSIMKTAGKTVFGDSSKSAVDTDKITDVSGVTPIKE